MSTLNPSMIYCVVPEPLADELYDKLASYYDDDPNVTVIVDRRTGKDRRAGEEASPEIKERRILRDRRRSRIPGTFPDTDAPK